MVHPWLFTLLMHHPYACDPLNPHTASPLARAPSPSPTMVTLTPAVIKSKTRQTSLGEVRQLNMWGQDIGDVSILKQLPRVEILSLSVNAISSLRHFFWCSQLCELYLRKNSIQDLKVGTFTRFCCTIGFLAHFVSTAPWSTRRCSPLRLPRRCH